MQKLSLGISNKRPVSTQMTGLSNFGKKSRALSIPLIDIEQFMSNNHCFRGIKGDRLIHLSIIDYLQEWDSKKRCERFAKTSLLGKDGDKLSAIEPVEYAKRFEKFMIRNVFM